MKYDMFFYPAKKKETRHYTKKTAHKIEENHYIFM